MATYGGNDKIVKMLIDVGANVNHEGLFHDTPLHEAAEKGLSKRTKYSISSIE